MGNFEQRTTNAEHRTLARPSKLRCSKLDVHCSMFSKSQRAFTLIELMIVIALIGIMTAMILPEMRGTYEDALLRSTSRELLEAFQLAHSRAVSFNQPHCVRVDPASGEYRVEKRVRSNGREEFAALRDVIGSSGKLDTRIRIDFRPAGESFAEETPPSQQPLEPLDQSITFFSDGTADAKEVLLVDRQGFRLLLQMNPTTSRARVVDLPKQ